MEKDNGMPVQAQPIPEFKDMTVECKFKVSSLALLLRLAQASPKPEASFVEMATAFQEVGFTLQQAQNAYNKLVEEHNAESRPEAKEISNSN